MPWGEDEKQEEEASNALQCPVGTAGARLQLGGSPLAWPSLRVWGSAAGGGGSPSEIRYPCAPLSL